MDIHEQSYGAVMVLKPVGPLIQDESDHFRQRFKQVFEQNLGRVVVDLSAVPYFDSRGLEILVEATRELGQSGQYLKICAATVTASEVLTLTGLAPLFEHFDNINSAVRSFL